MSVDQKAINIYMSVTGPFAAQMAANGAAVQTFGAQANTGMAKAQVGLARFGATAGKIANGSMLAVAAALALSAKVAIDFQTSFTGVRKTVETSEAGFRKLSDGVRELATNIPISVNELNKIMELGGQLGVGPNSLLAFTDTIAKVGVTTTLATEEAATGFARLDNIMQLGGKSFDRMGSTVVDLGNNFAATEDEILKFALRVAPVGKTVGLAADEVFAIATAFTSVGIPAERGGTAIQKTLIKIANAAESGGQELDIFSQTANMTSDAFAKMVKNDPAEAFNAFVTGLSQVRSSGRNVFAVLDSLGLGNERVRQSLLAMANASGVLDDAFTMSKEAWNDNIALGIEADKRFGTVASQMLILKNNVQDFAIALGLELLPYISDLVKGLSAFFDWVVGLNPAVKTLTLAVLGLVAALTLAKAHPVILGLMVVAGAFMLIGRNASEAKKRVEILNTVLEGTAATKQDLVGLLGDDALKGLLGGGFSLKDVEKAVFGSVEDYEAFMELAKNRFRAANSDLITSDDMDFQFAASSNSDAFAKGVAEVLKRRGDIVEVEAKRAEERALRNRAKILGIDLPGFEEERRQIEKARAAARSLYRGREDLANQVIPDFRPVNLDEKQVGKVTDAIDKYRDNITSAFDDVKTSVESQIQMWYEFPEEFEKSFSEAIASFKRQITAVGNFEDFIAGLDLSPAVESALRSLVPSPAAMEAFLAQSEETINTQIDELTKQVGRRDVIVVKKWKLKVEAVEFVNANQFISDLSQLATDMFNDPENTATMTEIWQGIFNTSIDNAGPGMSKRIMDALIGAFGEGGRLRTEIDLTQSSLDLLYTTLLELSGDYEVNIDTFFTTRGTPTDPRLVNPLYTPPGSRYGKPERRAVGGNVFANRPYFVGEVGKELFVPFQSGKIIPNSGLGAAGSAVTNNASQSTTIIVQDSQHRDLRSDISAGLIAGGVNRQVEVLVKR